jgi:hypothetical protein
MVLRQTGLIPDMMNIPYLVAADITENRLAFYTPTYTCYSEKMGVSRNCNIHTIAYLIIVNK